MEFADSFKVRIVRCLHMIATGGRNRVAQSHTDFSSRLVHGQLLPFGMHSKTLSPIAQLGRSSLYAVGQKIPDPFTARDLVDHLNQRFAVAPGQLDSAGVLLGDDPVLVAFHRKCYRGPGRNAVHHVAVHPLGCLSDGLEVAYAAERSQSANDLVLHAAVLGRDPSLRNLNLPFARDGAGKASAAIEQDCIRHGLTRDRLGVFK